MCWLTVEPTICKLQGETWGEYWLSKQLAWEWHAEMIFSNKFHSWIKKLIWTILKLHILTLKVKFTISRVLCRFLQYYSLDVLCIFLAMAWLLSTMIRRYVVKNSKTHIKLKVQWGCGYWKIWEPLLKCIWKWIDLQEAYDNYLCPVYSFHFLHLLNK